MPHSCLQMLQLVGLLPMVAVAAAAGQSTNVCQVLDTNIPGRVSYPGNSIYSESVSSYYTNQERSLQPGCIFKPNSTSDVSQFIKLITATNGGYSTPQFAIRSGGHMLFSGAANVDQGITVDMRNMKSFALSRDLKMASLGGGSIWSNVYPQLVPYNVSALGGRVPGIAVGGFTSGGGINFMSRRHGWSCDNVYGYEVVLASGEVVYASAAQRQDLWLALKGGSNNFGVITRYDVATYPQGKMLGGVVQFNYTKSVLDAQAKAFSNFMNPTNFDDAADMGVIIGYKNPGGVYSVTNSLFYTEPVANPPVYQPFTSIPSAQSSLFVTDVGSLVSSFGKFLPTKLNRTIEFVYSFKNSDASLYSQLFSTWENSTKAIANVQGLQVQFLVQPQPVTNGTNSLGLMPNQTDIVMSVITAAYDNTSDDNLVVSTLQSLINTHVSIVQSKGLYINYKYLNYADSSQDPIASYGPQNKAFLQAVSKRYDPNGLFQKNVPGGFKLFK